MTIVELEPMLQLLIQIAQEQGRPSTLRAIRPEPDCFDVLGGWISRKSAIRRMETLS
jgi:hypothetical protein